MLDCGEMAGRKALKLMDTVRMYIPAGMASPSPPVGPALGQVSDCPHHTSLYAWLWCARAIPLIQKGVNIGLFCKEFNEQTKNIKEGIDLPVKISIMVTYIAAA